MDERTEISAGGVVYRQVRGEIEVVVAEQRDRITGDRTTRLPKGKIEPGETAERAAEREVAEEVGLETRVSADLGCVEYSYEEDSTRVCKKVQYFLMEWLPAEPRALDGEMDRFYWCALSEAERVLSFETERRVVGRARSRLAAATPG